jgi:hypothetical protein
MRFREVISAPLWLLAIIYFFLLSIVIVVLFDIPVSFAYGQQPFRLIRNSNGVADFTLLCTPSEI